MTVAHQNVTGHGDPLSITYGGSRGVHPIIDVAYTLPLNRYDTTFTASYRRNDFVVVESQFRALDLNSTSEIIGFTLRHPLYRTLTDELAIAITGERLYNKVTSIFDAPGFPSPFINGSSDTGVSAVSALRVIQEYVHRTATSVIAVRSRFSVGLDVLNATTNSGLSRDGEPLPDGRFFSWLGQLQGVRRFDDWWGMQLLGQLNLQLANDRLFPLEQIPLGGRFSVRGYRENTLIRDNGFIFSSESRFPLLRYASGEPLLQFAQFVDVGRAWQAKGDTPDPQTLASVGLGLRWMVLPKDRARFELYWGSAAQSRRPSIRQFAGLRDSSSSGGPSLLAIMSPMDAFNRPYVLFVKLGTYCLGLAMAVLLVAAPSDSHDVTTPAGSAMKQGGLAFQRGAFGEALSHWKQAVELYKGSGNTPAQVEALVLSAQASMGLGQSKQALQSLELALAIAQKSDDPLPEATALGHLGRTYLTLGQVTEASEYLQQASVLAKQQNASPLLASTLNDLGVLLALQQQDKEALDTFQDSVAHAQRATLPLLAAMARTNAARTLLRLDRPANSRAALDEALDHLKDLPPSRQKSLGLIGIALSYQRLFPHLPQTRDPLLLRAAGVLQEAATISERQGDKRTLSYALGYLGHLYETESRLDDALQLTRRALFAAQSVDAPESLYRWQWQLGRQLAPPANWITPLPPTDRRRRRSNRFAWRLHKPPPKALSPDKKLLNRCSLS
ncbi:MAG: tetratricopeptide repeat protein [Nitrospira sp.]|nr:tetratricopeptide repeat protein [Nitrospira sp.]